MWGRLRAVTCNYQDKHISNEDMRKSGEQYECNNWAASSRTHSTELRITCIYMSWCFRVQSVFRWGEENKPHLSVIHCLQWELCDSRKGGGGWNALGEVLKGVLAVHHSPAHLLAVWNRNDGGKKITVPLIALNWTRLQWAWQGANCAVPSVIKQCGQVVGTKAPRSAVKTLPSRSFFVSATGALI